MSKRVECVASVEYESWSVSGCYRDSYCVSPNLARSSISFVPTKEGECRDKANKKRASFR